MKDSWKRWGFAVWLAALCILTAAHFLNLSADFPNHTPWISDWAKYTDEGWYGNAAIRAHLFGNWYIPGDFNPAPAVPVWPFLEWLLFFITGVNIEAARGLSVAFFCLDLVFAYLLLRRGNSPWVALLGVTLAVSSPFLYAFSRLGILEPMLICYLLAALNLAVRLGRWARPLLVSTAIGLLYTVMLLTKTSAAFLLPALAWAILASRPLRQSWKFAVVAGFTSAVSFASWMALVIHYHLLTDYRYLFFINKYEKPTEWYWPVLSLWWSIRGAMWGDRVLIPLAAIVFVAGLIAWRTRWSRVLRADAAFVPCALTCIGYILFMTYQNHPQPRYYTVVTYFAFLILTLGVGALATTARWERAISEDASNPKGSAVPVVGAMASAACVLLIGFNTAAVSQFVTHPEYTYLDAARQLTAYIDQHPNGKRLLLSISGDQITLMTHLPSLCDDFGTLDLPKKVAKYEPGWWATWNDIDPGTLEDLHLRYSLEQVASFRAYDHPERSQLVLFKLHPLPHGKVRDYGDADLAEPLPGDRILIPIE